ncbi:hypothetical protein Cgig2_011450 [Carnegiea gigantea]|uniref:Uncharacterized protein n=1 Tax=Carnegiea gigantea TaxID=171969 RepID=A0A9Q1QNZ1_9CARY|nr:hypothetical protein Cgig2_011450 [Carnegiea gigantea]
MNRSKARDHLDMATGATKLKSCMQSSNNFVEWTLSLGTVQEETRCRCMLQYTMKFVNSLIFPVALIRQKAFNIAWVRIFWKGPSEMDTLLFTIQKYRLSKESLMDELLTDILAACHFDDQDSEQCGTTELVCSNSSSLPFTNPTESQLLRPERRARESYERGARKRLQWIYHFHADSKCLMCLVIVIFC